MCAIFFGIDFNNLIHSNLGYYSLNTLKMKLVQIISCNNTIDDIYTVRNKYQLIQIDVFLNYIPNLFSNSNK